MIRTLLIFIHLGSFALSFGLVLFCDLMLAQVAFTGRIKEFQMTLISKASKVILKSLGILILSGLGFLVLYHFRTPELLDNPKLYAKILIVAILTANGSWLHRSGLLFLEKALKNDLRQKGKIHFLEKLLLSGAVSAVSWWTAFALGVFKELNFTASFTLIMTVYGVVLVAGCLGVEVYLFVQHFWQQQLLRHQQRKVKPKKLRENRSLAHP